MRKSEVTPLFQMSFGDLMQLGDKADDLMERDAAELQEVTTFDDDIDAQDDAIRQRDSATEDRIELGNALYKKITELFDYGKNYWVTRDEAKYNDYVIYDQPAGNDLFFDGTTAGGGTVENVIDATEVSEYVSGVELRIKNTTNVADGGSLFFYAANNATEGWNGLGQNLSPGQETTFTLDAMQYRPYFNIQNQGPNDQSWEVEIL